MTNETNNAPARHPGSPANHSSAARRVSRIAIMPSAVPEAPTDHERALADRVMAMRRLVSERFCDETDGILIRDALLEALNCLAAIRLTREVFGPLEQADPALGADVRTAFRAFARATKLEAGEG